MGHPRQIDQALNRASIEGLPDRLVFALDLFPGRVRRNINPEQAQARERTLHGLRLFGIDIPPHPTWEQVQAEYETVWQTLNGRLIESLIDLPLMRSEERRVGKECRSRW